MNARARVSAPAAGPARPRRPGPQVLQLAAVALLIAALTAAPASAQGQDAQLGRGAFLFQRDCAFCHGATGAGTTRAPGVRSGGAALAYYYLATGRMPLDDPSEVPRRSEPAYAPDDIARLVRYVASLGEADRPVPRVSPRPEAVAEGARLYATNCMACHGAAGRGGALPERNVPPLAPAGLREAAAAVRAGPGRMPAFPDSVMDDRELGALLAYVAGLDAEIGPGGLTLGQRLASAETVVAWLVGLAAIVLACLWIARRT